MCLHNILGKPEKTSGIGYKVYLKDGDNISTYAYNTMGIFIYNRETLHIGDKLTAVKTIEYANDRQVYETGFHVFVDPMDARDYSPKLMDSVVVKVRYDNARIDGTHTTKGDKTAPCIIADEITLLEIVH